MKVFRISIAQCTFVAVITQFNHIYTTSIEEIGFQRKIKFTKLYFFSIAQIEQNISMLDIGKDSKIKNSNKNLYENNINISHNVVN